MTVFTDIYIAHPEIDIKLLFKVYKMPNIKAIKLGPGAAVFRFPTISEVGSAITRVSILLNEGKISLDPDTSFLNFINNLKTIRVFEVFVPNHCPAVSSHFSRYFSDSLASKRDPKLSPPDVKEFYDLASEFIQTTSGHRYNSKKPSFSSLSPENLDKLKNVMDWSLLGYISKLVKLYDESFVPTQFFGHISTVELYMKSMASMEHITHFHVHYYGMPCFSSVLHKLIEGEYPSTHKFKKVLISTLLPQQSFLFDIVTLPRLGFPIQKGRRQLSFEYNTEISNFFAECLVDFTHDPTKPFHDYWKSGQDATEVGYRYFSYKELGEIVENDFSMDFSGMLKIDD
ncbi:uncharacterized protein SAPINGB_P006292 [Magnusiomyces paraingens]|uniref:Uncharacterized protein n=1 Tax=Magnusiomyces paraingens TaxID=2606893 RepID=A0A5E8C470_9ASCO|nr:uncharacterized protein SAPINGB_P006292 [Saprochaete ingens]VVT58604.1 unnamed protein product [Saprochaete ingens]